VHYLIIDVERDGPRPGKYSMIGLSAVIVTDKGVIKRFANNLQPISDYYIMANLEFLQITREETLQYDDPHLVISEFLNWVYLNIPKGENYRIYSMCPAADWQFLNWYICEYNEEDNPLGYSCDCIKSLAHGVYKDLGMPVSSLRDKPNNHDAEDSYNDYTILKKLLKIINENQRV
jgi:hypothetical protein